MRRPPALWLALLAALLLLPPPPGGVGAQDEPYDEPLTVENAGLLTCVVGAGRLVTLPEQVERIAVADETLARVQIISPRELLLTGLVPGRTTLFAWLVDGRRLRYSLQADPDLDLVAKLVKDLDPGIVVETSGDAVILRGEVAERRIAREAVARAANLLPGTRLIDLLRSPEEEGEEGFAPDERLAAALAEVDPRIRVRRIQVGAEPEAAVDTYVLEGRVRNIATLVRAMTVAERQLGGPGVGVVAVEGGQGLAAGAFAGAQALGLAAQVSRDLVMTSPSGRVISFLEVDELPQILVSIRVLEIDRAKARTLGVDFQFNRVNSDGSSFSAETSTAGGGTAGNVLLSYVDQMNDIFTALDLLEDKQMARSVAEPNVLTLAGEQATVVIGGQIPIPTTTVNQVTTVQSFRFQEFGVRLNIRPTLVDGNVITLEVSPEITRTQGAAGIGGVPAFTFRNVRTTARVPAGQSLVIAGLMDFEEEVQDRRLPGLGWLPIFRWKRRGRQETELIFVITPRLVEIDPSLASEPVPPLDGARIELPPLEWPKGRQRWRDAFDPETLLMPEGVPPGFLDEDWDPSDSTLVPAPRPTSPPEDEPPSIEERRGVVFGSEAIPETEGEDAAGAGLAMAEDAAGVDPAMAGDAAGMGVETSDIAGEPAVWQVASWVVPCLNLRAEPGLWREPLACLPPGRPATELESTDGWKRVRLFDGREGWLAGSYLEPVHGQVLQAASWRAAPAFGRCLAVRSDPSAGSPVLDCLPADTPLEVLVSDGVWSRVRLLDGREGWAAEELLRRAE